MPILIIILLAILVAMFGFWDVLSAILGAVGLVILLVVVGVALAAAAGYAAVKRRRRR
jgi:LPXTG-motif cell wall-anchored protein